MSDGRASTCTPDENRIFELIDVTVPVVNHRMFRRSKKALLVDRVNLAVGRGETIGIQGPSGAGKSTLARAMVGLNPMTSGEVLFGGSNILAMSGAELRRVRQRVQLVLQGTSSLSPYHQVRDILSEPLRNFGFEKAGWVNRVDEVMEQLSLKPDLASRYPNQLSGGQQQRVSIARALIVEPELVVFDEPVCSLDKVVQLSVLDNLRDRQLENSLTFVIITHDPNIASYMCDEVLTIVDGRIV